MANDPSGYSALPGTLLERFLKDGGFRFNRLVIDGIDNSPVFNVNASDMPLQEICPFHEPVPSGDELPCYHRYHGAADLSRQFVRALDGKSVCIVISTYWWF